MGEREVFDAEAEERRWWEAWYAEDYSWEGLGKLDTRGLPRQPWVGWGVFSRGKYEYCQILSDEPEGKIVRHASLQDYWRADPENRWRLRSDEQMRVAGELADSNGRTWHIVHLPDRFESGTKHGWKAAQRNPKWQILDNILMLRLRAAAETPSDENGQLSGPDKRAQLKGAVLSGEMPRYCQEQVPLHIMAPQSAHLYEAYYHGCIFESFLDMKRTYFAGNVIFSDIKFTYYSSFERLIAFKGFTFRKLISQKGVNFNGAQFVGAFNLQDNARFNEIVDFGDAKFFSSFYLYGVKFDKFANFSSANFSENSMFSDVTFDGGAIFTKSTFSAGTWFISAKFKKGAVFSHAEFNQAVKFHAAEFRGQTLFRATRFSAPADFSNITFLGTEGNWRGAFDRARFRDFFDFRDSPYRLISMFDGARFEGGIAYPKPGEMDALRIFDKAVIDPILKGDSDQHDEALKAVEGGAQVLKHQMRLQADSLREQRFYRFELIARRLQSTTHWSERVSSHLFGWLADYGLSVSRPLGWLVVTMALCATAYFGLARSAGLLDPAGASQSVRVAIAPGHYYREVPSAQELILGQVVDGPSQRLNALGNASASRIAEAMTKGPILFAVELGFIPVSDPISHHTWAKDLSAQDSWQSAVFAGLRLAQRLLSLILIFLTALALRRRFQIG
ncbi:MAG: pentapeptide repeat-containing protein [Oceanicaulis sp.]|nr:pentapeptide repeat-containing protein [Oceanicaulis sp.]